MSLRVTSECPEIQFSDEPLIESGEDAAANTFDPASVSNDVAFQIVIPACIQ